MTAYWTVQMHLPCCQLWPLPQMLQHLWHCHWRKPGRLMHLPQKLLVHLSPCWKALQSKTCSDPTQAMCAQPEPQAHDQAPCLHSRTCQSNCRGVLTS